MNLVIYMSYICNLRCPYCYIRNSGTSVVLSRKSALYAVNRFLELYGRDAKITFLGGEPLLHKKLLVSIVQHVRRKSSCPIHIFTNGMKLTKDFAAFAQDKRIKIVLSLNQFNFFEVKEIRKIFRESARRGATASFVATREKIGEVSRLVKEIYNFGFRHIMWTPDITEIWPDADIRIIQREMMKIRKWYFEIIRGGGKVYEMGNVYELIFECLDKDYNPRYCPNIILLPSGHFIPCDKAVSADKTGMKKFLSLRIDAEKRHSFFSVARRYGAGVRSLLCSAGAFAYFHYCMKLSGERLRSAIASHKKLAKVMRKEYMSLIKSAITCRAFCEVHNIELRKNRGLTCQ